MTDALCSRLDWDSDFFGIRVGRLHRDTLDKKTVTSCLQSCAEQRIDLLYFLARCNHQPTVQLATRHNFILVDVRVALAGKLPPPQGSEVTSVRLAQPGDHEALAAIARVSHRDSRFYFDSRIDNQRCDALYEAWIRKSCADFADAVLVADYSGRPAGYVTCHLDGANWGHIGLIAVDEAAQGQGIGTKLILAAQQWFAEHDCLNVGVVTQGRNSRAIRMYERVGFCVRNISYWFHFWPAQEKEQT